MAIPFHKAVSSIESIQSSIETDRQVYRWFLMLISLPLIKNQLSDISQSSQLYKKAQKIIIAEMVIYGTLMILIFSIYMTHQKLLALAVLPLFLILQRIYAANRYCVAKISVLLLRRDFEPSQLASQTIFQICEHYSRKLDIPSLVDIITRQDGIARKTLIYANVFACFIYPLDFWHIWAVIIFSFYLVLAATHTSFIFNKLK